MKTLHISLIKKWYDLTESGEKTEEYRELSPYWCNRLLTKVLVPWGGFMSPVRDLINGDFDFKGWRAFAGEPFKEFDAIKAVNGYGSKRPNWTRKFEGIEVREGREEWGAIPGKKYFVIKLGDRLEV